MKHYMQLFLIIVLLSNVLIIPTAEAASQYNTSAGTLSLSVSKKSDTEFILTSDEKEIEIDGGKFQIDGGSGTVLSEFKTSDLISTYKVLETYSGEMEYGNTGWNQMLNISGAILAGNPSQMTGNPVSAIFQSNFLVGQGSNPGKDAQVISDAILMQIALNIAGETTVENLVPLKTAIESFNQTRDVSGYLGHGLETYKAHFGGTKLDGIKGIKKYYGEKTGSLNTVRAENTQELIMLEKYGKELAGTPSKVNLTNYDDAEKVVAFLSWDKASSSEYYTAIVTALGKGGVGQAQILHDIINSLRHGGDNPLFEQQKIALISIAKGRHSIGKELDVPERLGSTAFATNLQAKMHTDVEYANIQKYLANVYPDEISSNKNRYTFANRLKYHFYARYITDEELGDSLEKVNGLTADTGIDKHLYGIKAAVPTEVIPNYLQQARLNDTLQELVGARELVLKDLKLVDDTNKSTPQVIEALGYVRSLKAGITFLEGIPYGEFEPFIEYWYEKVDGESMESTYQKVLDLGLIKADTPLDEATQVEPEEPLSRYFSLTDKKLSLNLKIGIAQSARYVPLKTNIYDSSTYRGIESKDFFNEMHYIWGYNRKALYIDTSSKSASNLYNTGKPGTLRVATLKDFLEGKSDIVIYSDTDFYNENRLLSLEEKIGNTQEKADEAVSELQTKWEIAEDLVNHDISSLVGREMAERAEKLSAKVTQYTTATSEFLKTATTNEDSLFLSKGAIDEQFKTVEYSVLKPFSVVSAVYRDKKTAAFLSGISESPVFVASETLGKITGTGYSQKASIMNYAIVQNMRENRLIDYKSSIDYNNPVFMDIYGNIVTATGTVVIPAAANATLFNKYNPYTAALLSTYGTTYHIPNEHLFPGIMDGTAASSESQLMIKSEDKTGWQFKPISVESLVDLNALATSDEDTLTTLYNLTRKSLDANEFKNEEYIRNILINVMKGAPMESMDFEAEGLTTYEDVYKKGLAQTHKLDELKDVLGSVGNNSLLSIPNPMFMEGIEIYLFFGFKIAILFAFCLILFQLAQMTFRNQFNLWSIVKLAGTTAAVALFVYIVPLSANLSYYQINKALLQDETVKLSMLNLEKLESGSELGVILQPADVKSQLLIKLEDIKVPIGDMITEVMFQPSLRQMMEEHQATIPNRLVGLDENAITRGKGIYLDVADIYSSSLLVYEPSYRTLKQQTIGTTPFSHYSPYYVFLDSMIANINGYNIENNTYSYTTNTYSGGQVRTIGLVDDFFTSDKFMKDEKGIDYLHLRSVYESDAVGNEGSPYEEEEMIKMRDSLWYHDNLNPDKVEEYILILNQKAKDFVTENRALLGRISDETFLEVMAMYLAIEYNKLFKIGTANSIDIYNITSEDLLRVSIANHREAMEGSSMSYSRFIYEVSGQIGVYLAAVLEIVVFVAGVMKPLMILTLFGILFISVFYFMLILRVETQRITGMIYTVLYLNVINAAYALSIKFAMAIPNIGVPMSLAILIQIIMHLVFILMYLGVLYLVSSNVPGFGSDSYERVQSYAKEFARDKWGKGMDRLPKYKRNDDGGWEKYDSKVNADKVRESYGMPTGSAGDPPSASRYDKPRARDMEDSYATAERETTPRQDERPKHREVPTDRPAKYVLSEEVKEVDGVNQYIYTYNDGTVETSTRRKTKHE